MQSLVAWLAHAVRRAGWAPLTVLCLHVLASRVFHAYARVPHLDDILHFLGGVAIAFFLHLLSLEGSRRGMLAPYQRMTHIALVFAFTCTAALFWEFAECLSDRYLGTQAQGNDLADTMLDMFLGVLGGVFFLVIAWVLGQVPAHDRGN
jgi:hypothetical protein